MEENKALELLDVKKEAVKLSLFATDKVMALSEFAQKRAADYVSVLVEQAEKSTSADRMFDIINESAADERIRWTSKAIVISTLLKGKTKKEITALIKKAQVKLGYGKSQVYEYKQAGEKLLTLKNGDEIPTNMHDFTREKKEKAEIRKFVNCAKIGFFKISEKEKFIYSCEKIDENDKKREAYFHVEHEIKSAELKVSYVRNMTTGKDDPIYFDGDDQIDVTECKL